MLPFFSVDSDALAVGADAHSDHTFAFGVPACALFILFGMTAALRDYRSFDMLHAPKLHVCVVAAASEQKRICRGPRHRVNYLVVLA